MISKKEIIIFKQRLWPTKLILKISKTCPSEHAFQAWLRVLASLPQQIITTHRNTINVFSFQSVCIGLTSVSLSIYNVARFSALKLKQSYQKLQVFSHPDLMYRSLMSIELFPFIIDEKKSCRNSTESPLTQCSI